MIASLGTSLLVIVLFFTGLAMLLVLTVHIESTLQNPRPHKVRVPEDRRRTR